MARHSDASVAKSGASYKIREDCRLCEHQALDQVLTLTPTPPANELLRSVEGSLGQDRFPLFLSQCRSCGHVQLPVVVDPVRLFQDYLYVSGTSPVFTEHLRQYASSVIERFGLRGPEHSVVEIGSNDGTFLRNFKDAGMRVLGVDPAKDIAGRATASGLETVPDFFSLPLARSLSSERGRPSLIVANNVFAHADDLRGMASAVKELLHPSGVFIFEVQYLADLCEKAMFDMVYHEHTSYHHVIPLVPFFESFGMRLFDVEHVGVHGGSIRCYVDAGVRPVSESVTRIQYMERLAGLGPSDPRAKALSDLRDKIESVRSGLTGLMRGVMASGGRIAGYGAPAKACTLSHHFGIGRDDVRFIVEDNPLKHGLFLPGLGIPILPPSAILEDGGPDHLIILAWNYADDIMQKPVCRSFKEKGGKFIVPFPDMKMT